MLTFLPNRRSRNLRRVPDEIQKSVQSIEDIFMKAHNDIFHKIWWIEMQGSDISNVATWHKHWYTRGNILALDASFMDELFERQPVVDPAHLSAHMQAAIMQYVQMDPDERESLERPILGQALAVLGALRAFVGSTGLYHAFHFATFLRAQLLLSNYDDVWSTDDRRTASGVVDAIIRACVSRKAPENSDWTAVKFPEYFDYAAARRLLWSTMQEIKCNDSDYHNYKQCFHKTNLPMLQKLQKEAQKEIRGRVMLAAGRQLPVELADVVYECALFAESIPADWRIEEPFNKQRTTIDELNYLIRAEYRCGRTRPYNMLCDSDTSGAFAV